MVEIILLVSQVLCFFGVLFLLGFKEIVRNKEQQELLKHINKLVNKLMSRSFPEYIGSKANAHAVAGIRKREEIEPRYVSADGLTE